MTPTEAGLIRAALRGAQVCALAALGIGFDEHWWLGVILLPVIVAIVWGWQVLYENVP